MKAGSVLISSVAEWTQILHFLWSLSETENFFRITHSVVLCCTRHLVYLSCNEGEAFCLTMAHLVRIKMFHMQFTKLNN
jgi:hypothetical protein